MREKGNRSDGRTLVFKGRVGARVAQPHVEAGVVGGEGAAASDAVGDPAQRGVQDAVHEKYHVLRIWGDHTPVHSSQIC